MKIQVYVPPRLRLSPLALVLLALMGIAVMVAMVRYIYGIGAISDLSNSYPWGFWISFDIYTGIAISSGAFLLAAAVYIFDLPELRPLLMPSLLTALIGYLMEVLALLVDLGHPERILNMLFYQNYTSHMLVLGLCVMIYLGIVAVEFSPVVLARFRLAGLARTARKVMLPVVILGVVVSTIHQGSLGSLLLIQPAKLSPLWWTPLLPVMFFLSSIPIGLAMIIFEASMSSRYFRRGLEVGLLGKLARAIPVALAVYMVVRFGQLALAGTLQDAFRGGPMTLLFWAEILVGSVAPLILFSFRGIRQSSRGLLGGSIVLLVGMILNRFNVSWFAVRHADPLTYIPAFMSNVRYLPTLAELSISIGIFAFGILAFGVASKYLRLFESDEHPGPAAVRKLRSSARAVGD